MSWNQITGHEKLLEFFRAGFEKKRLANTYLFVGPEGVGKRLFALELAKTLFCRNRHDFHACGECSSCIQIDSQTHPDLIMVSKPPEKNFLPVELFVGDREHRRQTGLCHDIYLTPFSGDRKIAIVDDTDFFNAESANSLLKVLEEPPNDSMLVLIGTSEQRQLPTILSRCQVVRFNRLKDQQVMEILTRNNFEASMGLESLARTAEGSVSRAIELSDEGLFEFRSNLISRMSSLDPAEGGFAKEVSEFVEGVSKEPAVRRRTMVMLGEFSIQLFSKTLRAAFESVNVDDSADSESVSRILKQRNRQQLAVLLPTMIERTMQFQKHVETNMAMANIVPSWLNDLGAIAREEKKCVFA